MASINRVENTPQQLSSLEMDSSLKSSSSPTVHVDTIDTKASSPTPSKLSEIFASFWEWLKAPFAGSELKTIEGEMKVPSIKAPIEGSQLRPPLPISNKELEIAMEELKALYKKLESPLQAASKISLDEAVVEQYKEQTELYGEAIHQAREKFASKQKLRKEENQVYLEARKELDKVGVDGQWWQNAYTYGMYGVAAVTALAALYFFSTAPAGEGLSRTLEGITKVGGSLFAGTSAINTVAQANLNYKLTEKQGKVTILRIQKQISDIKLRGMIDFLTNHFSKYNLLFKAMRDLGDKAYQTIQLISSR